MKPKRIRLEVDLQPSIEDTYRVTFQIVDAKDRIHCNSRSITHVMREQYFGSWFRLLTDKLVDEMEEHLKTLEVVK